MTESLALDSLTWAVPLARNRWAVSPSFLFLLWKIDFTTWTDEPYFLGPP